MSIGSSRAKCLLSFFMFVFFLFLCCSSLLHVVLLFLHVKFDLGVVWSISIGAKCSNCSWASYFHILCRNLYSLCCCFDFRLLESCLQFYSIHMMCLESFYFLNPNMFCLVMYFLICHQFYVVLNLLIIFVSWFKLSPDLYFCVCWSFGASFF